MAGNLSWKMVFLTEQKELSTSFYCKEVCFSSADITDNNTLSFSVKVVATAFNSLKFTY